MRAGLIGGLGPESTIDYYRRILALWQERCPGSAPSLVIDSLDVDRGIHLVRHDRAGLVAYLAESAQRLVAAGADFVAMTANTPHVVFDELARHVRVPLLSIVEVCADEAAARGLRTVGLLGTGFTMESTMYPTVFGRRGIDVVTPGAEERAWLHEHYIAELLRGDFRDETRDGVARIIEAMRERAGIEGVVLGGTELPLLLGSDAGAGLEMLDTTELHVGAIVELLGQDRVRGPDAESREREREAIPETVEER